MVLSAGLERGSYNSCSRFWFDPRAFSTTGEDGNDRDAEAHLDGLLKLRPSVVWLLQVCRTLSVAQKPSCRPGPPTNGPDLRLSAQTRTILIVWRADGAQGRFDLFRAADARLKTASLFTSDVCPSQMVPPAEGPGPSPVRWTWFFFPGVVTRRNRNTCDQRCFRRLMMLIHQLTHSCRV